MALAVPLGAALCPCAHSSVGARCVTGCPAEADSPMAGVRKASSKSWGAHQSAPSLCTVLG